MTRLGDEDERRGHLSMSADRRVAQPVLKAQHRGKLSPAAGNFPSHPRNSNQNCRETQPAPEGDLWGIFE
jgi:hypothetical protein